MEQNTSLGQYLKEVETKSMLPIDRERELAKRKAAGDKKARAELITSNLRLVIKFAKQFQDQGCDLEELIQEGNIGLMEGVDKYNLNFGVKVCTYVSWWIRQKMDRFVSNHSRNVRTPVHVLTLSSKLRKILDSYRNEFSSELTIEEIAKLLNCSEDMARSAYQSVAFGGDFSIDNASEKSNNISSKLKDGSVNPLENVLNEEIYEIIRESLSELSDRDEKIIRLRFGITEDDTNHYNFPISEEEMTSQIYSRIMTNKEELMLGLQNE